MKTFKVVFTDYEYDDLRFEEKVFEEMPSIELVKGKARTEEEVIKLARDADGLINQYAPISANVLDQLTACKVISRYGVGVNTIDIPKATEKGIYVANVPDYCMDEVSDHTLALLMSWARKVVLLNSYVKNKIWDFKKGTPIHRFATQTVGVLGFGRIPRRLVKKLNTIGFNVLVHDPYVSEGDILQAGAHPASLEDVFQQSDFISIHTPLTKETEGMINKDLFTLAKKSLVLINTSRGPVINEPDLIGALQTGQIAGAALDVVEQEPMATNHPFLHMDNVILTPHIAWYSEEAQSEMRTKCARNVLEVLQGKLPTYLVNRDVTQKMT